MLSETIIHKFSQLVYLDLPAETAADGSPTVGRLADYYANDPVGKRYLKTRFASIPQEYEDWKRFLADGAADVGDFRIRNILDDNGRQGSGFYGCSYISPQNQMVVAFRGSEMLGNRRYRSDYATDLALAYELQTPQHRMVEEYYAAFDQIAARPHYLTGHSLGGNLAAYGAVHAPAPERVLGCYCFNAPGFNREFFAKNRGRIEAMADRLHLMQNEHDIVSSLLLDPVPPVVLASLFHPRDVEKPGVSDLLYPHSNFVYQRRGDAFVRTGGEKDPLCRLVSQLADWFLLLPGPVKKAVAKMILEVLYSVQPPEKQAEFLLEGLSKYMVETGAQEEKDFALEKSLAAARMLNRREGTAALYQQVVEREGDGPGERAKAALLLIRMAQYARGGEGKPG